MLPLICDLQSIEEAGAAVIQEFGFVTLKDDYGSVSNPVVLCRLAQYLLLELLLHHPADCKLLECPRNKNEFWADGFPSNELSDVLCSSSDVEQVQRKASSTGSPPNQRLIAGCCL